MASRTLFPPLVNSYEPAFVAGSSSSLRVYFSLSSLSNIDLTELKDGFCVHAQIYRQDGIGVLNTKEEPIIRDRRYRATGILINLEPRQIDENYYCVEILNEDLRSSANLSGYHYEGWIPGWVYKVQLRISTEWYDPNNYPLESSWVETYSDYFSEWSTACYVKAISPMKITLPVFDYVNTGINDYSYLPVVDDSNYTINELDLTGSIESLIPEANENFNYVKFSLYNSDGELLEKSGEIYRTEQSNSFFTYKVKTKLKDDEYYLLGFDYETENGYVPSTPITFNFNVQSAGKEVLDATLITVDIDTNNILKDLTYLDEEEDEGRIALKIHSPSDVPYYGNICVQRASQDDNFQTWEDISIFLVNNKSLNSLDLIYDYTIESGKWYKYGIQPISVIGERGLLSEMDVPIRRTFNYSYLLGKGGQQLKLQFDNVINSFKHQIYDSKIDTIGSKYPFVMRNASTNYRTFPINTLISFNMDENNTFLKNGEKDIYKYNSVVNLNKADDIKNNRLFYNYTYEKDFRKKVLDFLQDGRPKLFKSPTEGNIIVRLTDVNTSPNKTLDRMISSINMNAYEIDEDTMSNYLKYGFYNVGTYSTSQETQEVTSVKIGQITDIFDVGNYTKDGVNNDRYATNIIEKIYSKYSDNYIEDESKKFSMGDIYGLKITVNGYYYLSGKDNIYFVPGHSTIVRNNAGLEVLGNNLAISPFTSNPNKKPMITIYNNDGIYVFDKEIRFKDNSNYSLKFINNLDPYVVAIDVTVDFYYETTTYYEPKVPSRKETVTKGIGQIYDHLAPGADIYELISAKYYYNSFPYERELTRITRLDIEADPYTVFEVGFKGEDDPISYEIGETGILRITDFDEKVIDNITYVGRRQMATQFDESTLSSVIDTSEKGSSDVSILYTYAAVTNKIISGKMPEKEEYRP